MASSRILAKRVNPGCWNGVDQWLRSKYCSGSSDWTSSVRRRLRKISDRSASMGAKLSMCWLKRIPWRSNLLRTRSWWLVFKIMMEEYWEKPSKYFTPCSRSGGWGYVQDGWNGSPTVVAEISWTRAEVSPRIPHHYQNNTPYIATLISLYIL